MSRFKVTRPSNQNKTAQKDMVARIMAIGLKLLESLAPLLVLMISLYLWYIGASLTIITLDTIGIPVSKLGFLRWIVPGGVSAVQLFWWPNFANKYLSKNGEMKIITFIVFSFLDLSSTLYGMILRVRGRFLPILTGITIPNEGGWLYVPAIIGSVIITFVPERLTIWSVRELREIWYPLPATP